MFRILRRHWIITFPSLHDSPHTLHTPLHTNTIHEHVCNTNMCVKSLAWKFYPGSILIQVYTSFLPPLAWKFPPTNVYAPWRPLHRRRPHRPERAPPTPRSLLLHTRGARGTESGRIRYVNTLIGCLEVVNRLFRTESGRIRYVWWESVLIRCLEVVNRLFRGVYGLNIHERVLRVMKEDGEKEGEGGRRRERRWEKIPILRSFMCVVLSNLLLHLLPPSSLPPKGLWLKATSSRVIRNSGKIRLLWCMGR